MPHRHAVYPFRVALAAYSPFPAGHIQEWPLPGGQNGSDNVIGKGRRPGRRAHLRQRHPAGPAPQRRPQDQVRERQVGQQLPVGHKRVQPVKAGLGEVRMPAGKVGQGRHSAIIAPGPDPGMPPACSFLPWWFSWLCRHRRFRRARLVEDHVRVTPPAGRN